MPKQRNHRRSFSLTLAAAICAMAALFAHAAVPAKSQPSRPNILLAIADDHSYPYAGAYGAKIDTPAFDRVAREGVLFKNAFCASPGCSPSRAALLTGRHTWQLEHAGTHDSEFTTTYVTYPDALEQAGYFVGYTGKGWGPGNWKASGRPRNPAGPVYEKRRLAAPKGITANDYAGNFEDFLAARPKDKPFCFWYGGHEPHRTYDEGIGLRSGKKLEDATVPPYLPDTPEVRSDLLDYYFEVEWFDRHLGRMLKLLEERGELDNTLVLVTADNGMSFPRAKANCYEYGIHPPLAVRWPGRVPRGRVIDDLVGFVDVAPTFFEAAGLPASKAMSGRSLMNLLVSKESGRIDPERVRVFSARERHSSARPGNAGYPIRAMRTAEFLYIRNFKPDLWPAGDPEGVGNDSFGFYDIDNGVSKTFLWEQRDNPKFAPFYHLAVEKRPAEELYDVAIDPGNLHNLASDPRHAETLKRLREDCEKTLRETGDPRMTGNGDVFETYKRFSKVRDFSK